MRTLRPLWRVVILFAGILGALPTHAYASTTCQRMRAVCAALEANLVTDPCMRELVAAATGGFLIAMIVFVCRWRGRVQRLEVQRNELQLAVMLRTREINREKMTIQRQKQQIEQLLEKAQQSNRLKDEFLANISHEIRTPLHGVIGMTELALSTDLTSDQREYLQLAESSAQSLLCLLNDVLDFSKIEAGQLALECVPFSVRECIETATGAFPLSAKKKGIEFAYSVAPEVPQMMEGDPVRLRQIILNLLSNALKFTHTGWVRLDVCLENVPADWTRCQGNPRICFAVEDTGIGIPKDKWKDIFEPFRQVDGSTTRKYGGTGLGLSICVRLAKQMGGDLVLESEEDRGSTFTLKVPVSQTPRANGPQPIIGEAFARYWEEGAQVAV